MADLPQYTGVTYDAGYFKQPQESMAEYMQRLAMQRASGVLGGGGMLNTAAVNQEITDKELGTVTQNCPSGYRWDGNACVPINVNEGSEPVKSEPVSKEQAYKGARWLLDNPAAATLLRAVTPLSGLFLNDFQLEGQVRNTQNEATKSQGLLDYLMGNDGDVVLGDRGTGSGSLVTGKETDITRGMFPEIFDPMNFTKQMGVVNSQVSPVNVSPTQGMMLGAITTGPDAINPTSNNWSIVDNSSSPTGSISVYTPSEWSPSDITSTPSTSNDTPDWYSAATGEDWN